MSAEMSFEIVTDSTANLPEAVIDQYNLHVLALVFNIDGVVHRSYIKDDIADLQAFYNMMRDGKVITTSLPSLKEVDAIVRNLFEQGKDVLYLGFDSALSGSYENTSSYLKNLQETQYPNCKLFCVDSLAAALGHGLFVLKAARMREAGASIDEVAKWAEANKRSVAHWFTVDDLHYLERGGRLSKGVAI
ncbi:MAG: DegV family EDD domain-containing protein, partial [Coriobacteriales bacterium]|nr:DegV family EDD domain-containing protein [Coriobacteriales bacterium]